MVISQFPAVIDNLDVLCELIKYWDMVFQKMRSSEATLAKKLVEFMYRLYWVLKSVAFCPDLSNPNASARGDVNVFASRLSLLESALLPLCTIGYASASKADCRVTRKADIFETAYRHFRIEELKVKRTADVSRPALQPMAAPSPNVPSTALLGAKKA